MTRPAGWLLESAAHLQTQAGCMPVCRWGGAVGRRETAVSLSGAVKKRHHSVFPLPLLLIPTVLSMLLLLLLLLCPVHIQQGRYVSVLRIKGQLTCIDSICFHAGGPLVSVCCRSTIGYRSAGTAQEDSVQASRQLGLVSLSCCGSSTPACLLAHQLADGYAKRCYHVCHNALVRVPALFFAWLPHAADPGRHRRRRRQVVSCLPLVSVLAVPSEPACMTTSVTRMLC